MSRTFESSAHNIKDGPNSGSREQVANDFFPSKARNLSLFKPQKKRDSSARSVPRNDNLLSFLGEGGREME
jgi:hypothetical protein